MSKPFDSSKVTVKDIDKKKGRGVVAKKRIKAGEIVEKVPTIEIDWDEVDLISHTILADYVYDSGDGRSVVALGYGSLYNHSTEPNADYVVGPGVIFYKALRDIKKGEEILIDYGWEGDR